MSLIAAVTTRYKNDQKQVEILEEQFIFGRKIRPSSPKKIVFRYRGNKVIQFRKVNSNTAQK